MSNVEACSSDRTSVSISSHWPYHSDWSVPPLRCGLMLAREAAPVGLDKQLVDVLRSRIASAEIVLFTGAGFSQGAIARDGQALPGSRELRRMLWPIAFPDDPEDQASSLGDVFDCALAQSASRVRETLNGCLRVDHSVLPDYYLSWFSVPWARAYTLNVDDLAVAADRALDLPRQVLAVSAADPVPTPSDELVYVDA